MNKPNRQSIAFLLIVLVTLLSFTSLQTLSGQPPLMVPATPSTSSQHASGSLPKIDYRLQSMMEKEDLNQEVEMIVTFQGISSTKGAELLKSLGNITVLETYTVISGALLKAPLGMAVNIASQNYVKSVTHNYEVKIHSTLDTTLQATATTYSANIDQIGATRLHQLGINGTGIKVAVLDTGINTHEALPPAKIIYARSFVPGEGTSDLNGHGTHVAGIIAGYSEGRYIGVAPGAQLLNIKVLNEAGEGKLSYLVSGIQEAVNQKAHVISISAGALINNPNDPVCQAANSAVLAGVVVVAAAGNEGPDGGTINAPGEAALAICVGAVTSSNLIPDFSSRGPTVDKRVGVDLVAPGVNIISLSYNNSSGYVSMSGTSQATPHISGVVALLLSYKNLTVSTVKAALMATAVDLGEDPYAQGCGLVNASAAYDLLESGKTPVAVSPLRIELISFGSQLSITVNFTIVGGLTTDNYLSNVRIEVRGGISGLITLSSTGTFDLNNTHKFVAATIYVPSYYMASFFSGSIDLVNGDGEVIASVTIQGIGPTSFLLMYLLSQEVASFYATALLIIVVGVAAGIAFILGYAIYRRKHWPPEEEFPPEPIDLGPLEGEPYRWPY
ncbi:MAG: S8 family serine peptidase [Candidatus Freyarchaeota archaeon]|nr:S8 family serine peptidase [Candidatus Jordarchaeia archaeon]